MNLKKTLSSILAGIVILTTPEISCGSHFRPSITTRATQTYEEDKVCKSIEEVLIRDFLRDYLAKVTPQSSNFKALEKKYGKEGLLERYVSAHDLCLETAFKFKDKDIPEQEYSALGKALARKQQDLSQGISPVDNLAPNVVQVYVAWGKERTDFFKKLMQATKRTTTSPGKPIDKKEYVKSLVQQSYSREEFEKYISGFTAITDKLYSQMHGTTDFLSRRFGKAQFDAIARCTREVYFELIDKFFKEDKFSGGKNGRH